MNMDRAEMKKRMLAAIGGPGVLVTIKPDLIGPCSLDEVTEGTGEEIVENMLAWLLES
jgi:hypothetical protein